MDAVQRMPLRVSLALVVLTALWVPAYAETPAQVTAEQLAVEREFWASVKESEDPADIRAYLEQYPGGIFEALARNWLKRLEEAAPRVPATSTISTQEAAPAPQPSPQSMEAALGLTRAQRVQVQRGLSALGFDVGAADGILGSSSRAGITRWQSSRGEAATGYLDAAAAERLLEAGEAASPEPRRPADREATQLLAEALSAARGIDDAGLRARALSAIAKVQATAGDTPGAAQTLSDALSATRSVDTARFRARALNSIADAQAIAGDIQGAVTTARSIENAAIRALALSDIAKAQARSGETRSAAQTVSEALTAARSSKRARLRAGALGGIAKAQAIAGDTGAAAQTVAEALISARSVKIAIFRAWALSDIVEAQAVAGDIQGALTITQAIEDAGFRVWALSHVAKAQARSGDTGAAAQTVSEALATIPKIEEAHERAPALSRIAGAQAIAGDIRGALTTAESIDEDEGNRALALSRIAEAQAIAGDIHSALTTARNIKEVLLRAEALSDIAKAQLDRTDVPSESDGRATQRATPTRSKTPDSERVASEGPWIAYVAGLGQVIGSTYFGLAWGHGTETEAVAAARAACIREGGTDIIDNCEYTETYKNKCMVVGEAQNTESTVFYPKVGDTESEAISRLRYYSDCGNCPIVANSCAH